MERQRLRRENEKLKEELDAARRAVYRQAAPFSRGTIVGPAARAGPQGWCGVWPPRASTRPAHIDETYDAPLPPQCPGCGGPAARGPLRDPISGRAAGAAPLRAALPHPRRSLSDVRSPRARAAIHCRRRTRLGAAAVQVGPQAVALAVVLNKDLGLPYGIVRAAVARAVRVERSPASGVVHAVRRAARQAQPTYDAAVHDRAWQSGRDTRRNELARRRRPAVALGVRHAGDDGLRDSTPAAGSRKRPPVIGADYAGILVRDGWQSYRQFTHARHQTCLARLLRRCRVLLLDYPDQPFCGRGQGPPPGGAAHAGAVRRGGVSPHAASRPPRPSTASGPGRRLALSPSRSGRRSAAFSAICSSSVTPSSPSSSSPRSTPADWRAEQGPATGGR